MLDKLNHLKDISIHALREEGDPNSDKSGASTFNFYPRPPRGGRHHTGNLYTDSNDISIHALREEGDGTPK